MRRISKVTNQKKLICAILICIVSIIIFLSSSIRAFANLVDNSPMNKYYTSIEINTGDTLWDLADEYIGNANVEKTDYIDEICKLNKLDKGNIHAGQHIIVAYYTTDVK